jgi:hypothetical protein
MELNRRTVLTWSLPAMDKLWGVDGMQVGGSVMVYRPSSWSMAL